MNNTIWENWKRAYDEQIHHVGDSGSIFIDTILSQIDEIDPSDVIPHYHFVDDEGQSRYTDFLIINKANNYRLPIEINGYSEIVGEQQYDQLNQFLEGKNAIIGKFGIVLCYSNKCMINNRESIIYEIRQTLENQNLGKSNQDIKASHTAQLIANYEQRLTELSEDQAQLQQDSQVLPLIKEMQEEINRLKQQQSNARVQPVPPVPVLPDASESDNDSEYYEYDEDYNSFSGLSRFWTIALSVIFSAVIVFVFTKKIMSDKEGDNAGYEVKDRVIERKEVESDKEILDALNEKDKDIQEPNFKVMPRRVENNVQQESRKTPPKQSTRPQPTPVRQVKKEQPKKEQTKKEQPKKEQVKKEQPKPPAPKPVQENPKPFIPSAVTDKIKAVVANNTQTKPKLASSTDDDPAPNSTPKKVAGAKEDPQPKKEAQTTPVEKVKPQPVKAPTPKEEPQPAKKLEQDKPVIVKEKAPEPSKNTSTPKSSDTIDVAEEDEPY